MTTKTPAKNAKPTAAEKKAFPNLSDAEILKIREDAAALGDKDDDNENDEDGEEDAPATFDPTSMAQQPGETVEAFAARLQTLLTKTLAEKDELSAALSSRKKLSATEQAKADKKAAWESLGELASEDSALGKFQRVEREALIRVVAKIVRMLPWKEVPALAVYLSGRVTEFRAEAGDVEKTEEAFLASNAAVVADALAASNRGRKPKNNGETATETPDEQPKTEDENSGDNDAPPVV